MNLRPSALWLVTSLAVFACNKDNEAQPTPAASASVTPPAASASAPSTATVDNPHGERGPGHGGIDAVLFRAARALQLSDAQKTKLATFEDDLHDRDTDPRDAMKSFASDLAAQVRAGKVEASKLQPDEAALDTAMKGMLEKQATALAGLHDTLDAGQRKALVDSVRAKSAAREAEAKARGGDASDWIARRLGRMTRDYALDDAQQRQASALLAKQPSPAAMGDDKTKQMDGLLTAFQGEAFDAAKALEATRKAPHDAMDRQIAFTSQLVQVLRPDQREKLAVSTAKPMGRGGPGGSSPPEDDDERGGNGGNAGGGGGGGGGGSN